MRPAPSSAPAASGETVAIIIPAYNAAPWIAEAIESALAQTHAPSAVVVVDDGSQDDTAALTSRYEGPARLIRQANAGVCAARNRGLAEVTADWLLFLDADDRLRPEAVAALLSRARAGRFGVIHGRSIDFRVSGRSEREHGNDSTEGPVPTAAKASFWKAPIATPGAALIRREALVQAGGWNERFNTTADRDLWCRIGAMAEFAYVAEPVIERRLHGENMSGDRNRARRQAVEVQLAFLAWCAEREVNPAFLGTSEREIFERNAERALAERAFTAGAWIATQARQRGYQHPLFDRATRLAGMPAFARDLEMKVREFLRL